MPEPEEPVIEPDRKARFEYDENDAEYLLGHINRPDDEQKEGQNQKNQNEEKSE